MGAASWKGEIMSSISDVNRRTFLKSTGVAGATLGLAGSALAAKPSARVLGANDRINVGVIGVGGRGTYVGRTFAEVGKDKANAQVLAVCDVYQKRVTANKTAHKERYQTEVEGYLDYREVLNRNDVDAVVIATPDHWHAKIALEAMDKGKDVYLEKPMCHTVEEAKQLIDTVKETKRVLQVGSQTTSGDQWHKAKQAIADGMIGEMILSQGSYHRNSREGEWNWPIDKEAGPDKKGEDFIDWKMWLGPAPNRPYNADRFFRFRKYWDYSGGIATDLFFHVAAPMNICWGTPQYPYKVMAGGGIYVFKDEREVPDTFHLIGEYSRGHSIVLSSSMANSQHIPGLIRGHKGSLIMVEHGRFEGYAPYITVRPELRVMGDEYRDKWGETDIKIQVENKDTMVSHVGNFLECMRTRQKPTLDVETAAKAQVLITMAVMSYRQGKVLYFDEQKYKVVDKAPRA
jgi:predicted dehydrogenase